MDRTTPRKLKVAYSATKFRVQGCWDFGCECAVLGLFGFGVRGYILGGLIMIRIGLWGILYCSPQNGIGNN